MKGRCIRHSTWNHTESKPAYTLRKSDPITIIHPLSQPVPVIAKSTCLLAQSRLYDKHKTRARSSMHSLHDQKADPADRYLGPWCDSFFGARFRNRAWRRCLCAARGNLSRCNLCSRLRRAMSPSAKSHLMVWLVWDEWTVVVRFLRFVCCLWEGKREFLELLCPALSLIIEHADSSM